ncbi:MAG: hypothetical protein Q8M76_12030 [Spirochaetaceae bacterium]|nr:hypothetical protein [Spirochaetaceae bacterium]
MKRVEGGKYRLRFARAVAPLSTIALVAIVVLAAGCGGAGGGGGGGTGGSVKAPGAFWGRWKALDSTQAEIYFSATGMRAGGGPEIAATAAAANLVSLADGTSAVLESENVLARGSERYLRAASPTGTLKGMLFDQARLGPERALSSVTAGLSGISLTITNVLNQEQKLQVQTGTGGAFSTPTDTPLIPGDQYAIKFPQEQGGATIFVTNPEPGGDAGVLTKTSLPYNLKLSYEFPDSAPRIYALGYSNVGGAFYLNVANSGTEKSPAGVWEYEVENPGYLGFHYYNFTGDAYSLAAIEPGSSARIPAYDPVAVDHGAIAISRSAIDADYVDERIIFRFKPKDASGNVTGVWEDFASLRIYKRPAKLWLYSKNAPVSALVVLPGENLSESLSTTSVSGYAGLYRASLEVPYRSAADYLIAAHGPAGTAFAIGLDVAGIPFDAVDAAPAAAGTNGSESTSRLLAYGDIAVSRLGSTPAFFRSDPANVPDTPALRVAPIGGSSGTPLVCSFSPLAVELGSYDANGLLVSDAVIRYSLDGGDLAAAGASGNGSVSLSFAAPGPERLRAVAEKPGWNPSAPLDLYYDFELSASADATIGAWRERAAAVVQGQAFFAIDDGSSVKRYRLGGGASLSEASESFEYFFLYSGSDNGAWMTLEAMPAPRTRLAWASLSVGGARFVYAIGGYNPGQTPNYRGEVFAFSMSSGKWSTASVALPWSAEGLGACVLDGRLYVAGGNEGSTAHARVARATPSAETATLGRIVSWDDGAVPDLGVARTQLGLAAVSAVGGGGWLFALGGDGVGSIETLEIAADGSCAGSWQDAGRPLPAAMPTVTLAIQGSRLYLIGALDGKVYRAEVDTVSGALGAFTEDRPLMPARRYAAASIAGGVLFVSGGASGTSSAESFTWGDMLEADIAP